MERLANCTPRESPEPFSWPANGEQRLFEADLDGETLLRLASEGDTRAFARLVDQLKVELFRYFKLHGLDAHSVEDCAQETFLRLYSYRRKIQPSPRAFRVLLYTVARHVYCDSLRKLRRSIETRPIEWALELSDPRAFETRSFDELKDLEIAVAALPPKLRSVVVLGFFQGLAYAEVAESLGIPVGTVKSRMSSAVLKLREVLGAREFA